MRIEKHLIGQIFIVRYMEDTDSDILGLGFLITSSLMWISNRGHVFRDGGIILHPSGVFSNVLMQKKRRGIRKTSDWSNIYCLEHGRYRQRYLRLRVLITSSLMWISNRGHVFRDGGIILHPRGVFSNVLMQKKRHGIRKTSDLSKSDCSIHDICRQRYRVYYESYRDEIVQGRVRSETASFDKI